MSTASATTRRWTRLLLGAALLAAAIWSVAANHQAAAAALQAIREPDPLWSLTLPLAVMLTAGCTAASLQLLTNRVIPEGRVHFAEMLSLTFASTLGNVLPLQAGLVGRVAYQHQVHGIPVAASVLLAVQSTLLTLGAVLWLGVALLLVHAGRLSWLAAPASILLLLPALAQSARGASPMLRAFAVRFIEVLLSALRIFAAFALIGRPIDPLSALVFGCAANAANCVPMVGNGLGIREWVTGLLAPTVAGIATPDALAAELVNRAVELLVFVPAGLAAAPALVRTLHRAMRTRRVAPNESFASGISLQIGSLAPQRGADEPVPNTPASSSD